MKLTKTFREFAHCKGGNALIIVAATLPLLIGASAIGVDTIQLTLAKRSLQRSADSAAVAGAFNVARDSTPTAAEIQGAVDRDLTLNNGMTLAETTVQNAPESGPFTGDARAVRVVLRAERSVPFMAFFTGSNMGIEVEATAAALPGGRYCVVSLESGNATGITFTGGGLADLGCGVGTNSPAAAAIALSGSTRATTSPVAAVGGVPPATDFVGPTVTIPGSLPLSDPYAGLPDPSPPSPCGAAVLVEPNRTRSLSPGCYRGMTLKGTVTLAAGVYHLDGPLVIESGATVTGTGVTFVMSSSTAATNPNSIGTVSIAGTATLNLSAPTTGPYAGLLLHMDPRAPLRTNYIRGSSSSVLDGGFYLPSQTVSFEGGAGMTVRCFRLVSRRAIFTGSSGMVNTCPADHDFRDLEAGRVVRLVN